MTKERFFAIKAMTPDVRAKLSKGEREAYDTICRYDEGFGQRVLEGAMALMEANDASLCDDALDVWNGHEKMMRALVASIIDSVDSTRKRDRFMSPTRSWGTTESIASLERANKADDESKTSKALEIINFADTVLTTGNLYEALLSTKEAAKQEYLGNSKEATDARAKALEKYGSAPQEDTDLMESIGSYLQGEDRQRWEARIEDMFAAAYRTKTLE